MKKTRVFHWLLAAGFTALWTVTTGVASGHQMGGFAGGGFHGSPGVGYGHSFGSRSAFHDNRFAGHGINNHFFPNHRRFFFGFDVVAFGFPYWWYPDFYYGYPYGYADYDASPVYDYRYWADLGHRSAGGISPPWLLPRVNRRSDRPRQPHRHSNLSKIEQFASHRAD